MPFLHEESFFCMIRAISSHSIWISFRGAGQWCRIFASIAKVKLLKCISSLDPTIGGPQEAIRQSCLWLPSLGHSVEVVCLDEPDAPWLHNYPAKVHALGPAELVLRGVYMLPY